MWCDLTSILCFFRSTNVTLFHEVEDEFANDDSFDDAAIVKMVITQIFWNYYSFVYSNFTNFYISFLKLQGPPIENTTESVLKKVESVSDDSNSNDTPVETQRQITTSDSE